MWEAAKPIDRFEVDITIDFAYTVGWGSENIINLDDTINLGNAVLSAKIKRLNLTILSDFECENLYHERIIGENHVCGLGVKKGEQIAVVIDLL